MSSGTGLRPFPEAAPRSPGPRPAAPAPTRARTATPPWWRDAAGSAAVASVVVVVALWLANGGVGDLFGGTGSSLTSAGRLAGLVSADLLLVQVLLMARIPWVERSYGQEIGRAHV